MLVMYIFCFFKQKTAYEMRISDWSSDVCSSDLLHPFRIDQQLVDNPGETRQREVQRDRRVGTDEALDRGVRDVALMPQSHVFHRRHGVGADDARLPGEIFGQDRVALVRHGRRALLAGRSEEHTSELQSLMRLSYAVFCLKKKKQEHKQKQYKSMKILYNL